VRLFILRPSPLSIRAFMSRRPSDKHHRYLLCFWKSRVNLPYPTFCIFLRTRSTATSLLIRSPTKMPSCNRAVRTQRPKRALISWFDRAALDVANASPTMTNIECMATALFMRSSTPVNSL
jgi:hypothetical protein